MSMIRLECRIEESKVKYLKIVHAGIAKWVKDFKDGRIEIKTVDDLRKLIEMDLELQQSSLLNGHRRARAARGSQ